MSAPTPQAGDPVRDQEAMTAAQLNFLEAGAGYCGASDVRALIAEIRRLQAVPPSPMVPKDPIYGEGEGDGSLVRAKVQGECPHCESHALVPINFCGACWRLSGEPQSLPSVPRKEGE